MYDVRIRLVTSVHLDRTMVYMREEVLEVFGARGVPRVSREESRHIAAGRLGAVNAARVPQRPHAAALAHVHTGLQHIFKWYISYGYLSVSDANAIY